MLAAMALLGLAGSAATAAPVVLSDVPAYDWHHGCGPTAAVSVIGYDDRGNDGLWYGLYTTWSEDETIVWEPFQAMGQPWGVAYGTYVHPGVIPALGGSRALRPWCRICRLAAQTPHGVMQAKQFSGLPALCRQPFFHGGAQVQETPGRGWSGGRTLGGFALPAFYSYRLPSPSGFLRASGLIGCTWNCPASQAVNADEHRDPVGSEPNLYLTADSFS